MAGATVPHTRGYQSCVALRQIKVRSFVPAFSKLNGPKTDGSCRREAAREVLNFFDWAYHNGSKLAEQLDYVPMPASVISAVEQSWKTIVGPDGKPIWTELLLGPQRL